MPNPFSFLKKQQTKSVALLTGNTFSGFENLFDTNNLTSYKDSLYLYIGVSMIAKRTAGIPLELYRIKNRQGDVEEVMDHPVLDLFYNPNPLMTQREFMEISIAHYLLAGDVFWYIDPAEKTLTPLRPDYVEVVLTADRKRVLAYEYRASEVHRFSPDDIIHIKNPDPSNLLRGVGVVQPASVRIATEQEASKYQSNFFKNQGRPDMAVFANRPINKEQNDEARSLWKGIFGRGQGGQVAFFGSDITSVQELNKTPKEMDFIASQHFLRDDILAALRIPKAMVTSDDVNLSNAREAYKMYLQEAVVPVLEAFLDVMNNRLLPRYDEALFFSFEDPTPNDRELNLKETTELKKAGIITANEARTIYDYEPAEGGDTLAVAATRPEVTTEAKAIIRRRPVLIKRFKATDELVNLIQLSQPKRQMNSIFATKEMKQNYAKAVNDRIDRKADVLKEAIDAFHKGMLERILATDLQPAGFMDPGAEKLAAKQALTPVVVKLYTEGGQDALDAIFKKSDDRFFADAVLIAAIEGRVAFFTESIVDTTFEVLKSKIVAGISNGDGPDTIASSLRDYFTDMSSGRAKTIARTETGYALSKAASDAYAQSSIVTGKEWITVGDDKVRPEHVENDGVIVGKGGSFPSGEEYPAQHSINCRCVVAPAL